MEQMWPVQYRDYSAVGSRVRQGGLPGMIQAPDAQTRAKGFDAYLAGSVRTRA